ncbi:DNA mismatch repair endonuclease MutL [Blattabacterium cuenoti]|uniref:DNA mismatch repair endonuclease MutL n=1 Tax=Blattabacterium cuenoti TaxID=1653831 RepID=UPI00163B9818|nr:DNA mismatch repair endonuclease MutL [Blattabacterium cuenoti]
MNKSVHILPLKIINQIAAGEVIERPSSVVRELLENSIDANASKIDIFIEDSGKTLIQLVDNGDGMSFFDAKMSIKKYATSKIKETNDLYHIRTKGFRGEALFSIALVSQLEIQTRYKGNSIGSYMFIEDGVIKKEISISMLKGTRISVKNIFYKFPARRKFLKSSRIELKHIIDEFYKIVLSHRTISYRFYHNNKMLFLFKKESLKKRIKEIIKNNNKNLKFVSINRDQFFVEGYFSIPDNDKKKGDQFIVVNKRCVNYSLIHNHIIRSYDGFLNKFKTISYFIFIYINPTLVNWNIHPSKKEVKLENEKIISDEIYREIKKNLFNQYKINHNLELNHSNIAFHYNFFEKNCINYNSHFHINEFFINNILINKSISNFILDETKIRSFQINKRYMIFTYEKDIMILLDRYRASQNILFEFFLKEKKIVSKHLFFPIEIGNTYNKIFILKNIKDDLENFGFRLYFWNKSVYLYSIPEKIEKNMLNEIFQNILQNNFIKGDHNNKKIIIRSITESASIKYKEKCHSHVRKSLIKELFSCDNPLYTFSGKPVYFIFNKNFFSKLFEK